MYILPALPVIHVELSAATMKRMAPSSLKPVSVSFSNGELLILPFDIRNDRFAWL
jgi:hypothetical protein